MGDLHTLVFAVHVGGMECPDHAQAADTFRRPIMCMLIMLTRNHYENCIIGDGSKFASSCSCFVRSSEYVLVTRFKFLV